MVEGGKPVTRMKTKKRSNSDAVKGGLYGEALQREVAVVNDPLANFDVGAVVRDMEVAVSNARSYYRRMEANEAVRLCLWEGKHESNRKVSKGTKKAKPWEGASDHEVHLAQEVLLQLTAQRVAAMQRGSLSVTPMNGTEARAATQMKLVLRYYLDTCMRSEKLVQGTRWASWALRYGHSVMYIGWKTLKAMEQQEVKESEMVNFVLQEQHAGGPNGAPADGMNGQDGQGAAPMVFTDEEMAAARLWVRESATPEELAGALLRMRSDLRARGKAAQGEALRCAKELRKAMAMAQSPDDEATGHYNAVFVKEDRPYWEALRTGVDFFCPPETMMQDSFDDARWLVRVRWMSAQQIREEGAVRGWDPEWILKVIKDCRGKSRLFTAQTVGTPWALANLGVGYGYTQPLMEMDRYQILEHYERRTTEDGVQCLYKTVMHADVPDLVASRELLPDWHGHYPFVPQTNEQDEPYLLENRGVPELCGSAQRAIKTQWDSRDDMAALTTLPPWTGPETLQGTPIAPGAFIPEWRTGSVSAFRLPPPDGRSIEIEKTLRGSVDRYFALMSESVPDALNMLMGQVGINWFLAGYSRAVALTAQLVGQRMPALTGARVTGTQIIFDATREGVRGNFEFSTSFDVRALDLEWMDRILKFVKDAMTNFDPGALTNRNVLLRLSYDMIDPALGDQLINSAQDAQQSEAAAMKDVLRGIFTGEVPQFQMGVDYATRLQTMKDDLRQSPVRQQIMQTNEYVRAVWEDYAQKLIMQIQQKGANKQAGIEGAGDPLQQSPLAVLKAGGWQALLGT